MGKGPKNLGRMGTGLRARGPSPRPSRASMPTASPRRASPGYTPPGGGGSGSPRATSPMTPPASTKINKPKTGNSRGRINLNPRADGVSRI